MTRIALISGDEVIDLKVLYCLYWAYPNIYIISNKPKSVLKYSRYKKSFAYFPWREAEDGQEQLVAGINEYLDKNAVDFVLPGSSDSNTFVHQYRQLFSNRPVLPTMDEDTIYQIDNKWTFAKKLMAEGISTPFTLSIESLDDISPEKKATIEREIGFPLIVKPAMGDGSQGVEKIDTYESLRQHLLNGGDYAKPPLIIQEYIDGYDIDLSFIAYDGDIVSMAVQRWASEGVLEFCRNEEMEDLARRIVSLYKYNGPGHFDMRISHKTGKLYVIECNPRFWRSITAAMWQGINFAEAAVKSTLGEPFDQSISSGDYLMPGKKIKNLLKKPWSYFSLPAQVKREIWYNLTDPLPHWVSNVRNRRGEL